MLSEAWASIHENYVFWVTLIIFHVLVIIFKPKAIPWLYGGAIFLYLLTGFLSFWPNVFYGIFAYFMWLCLLIPVSSAGNVPLIFFIIGSFVFGRWAAKL